MRAPACGLVRHLAVPVPRHPPRRVLRIETHHILAVTHEQLAQMDRWEGHPDWYERQPFNGPVLLETGAEPDQVLVYDGTRERRPALKVDGRSLGVAAHRQADVDGLVRP